MFNLGMGFPLSILIRIPALQGVISSDFNGIKL